MQTNNKIYITATELANALNVSVGYGYKICRSLNEDLKKAGFLTIAGKVPIKYFEEKWYGMKDHGDAIERVSR